MFRKLACRLSAVLAGLVVSFSPLLAEAGTTGGIQGYVTDTAGHPLAGVRVTAAAPSAQTSTLTGTDGFYSLNGLPLDTYRVTFMKDGYDTFVSPGVTLVQDQPIRLNVHLTQSGIRTLGKVTVRSSTSLVQPTVTADTYVINQQSLSNINGTPQDLNGFQAFNSLPGVTTDNFGYPVIRAGAENDVGYEYDGVDNTDAVTGQFLNAVSLNGARSVELSTGGYDVSAGNTNSGVINEVIQRGTYPGEGQATARISGPTYGHEISLDYGSATANNRFSYFLSYGGQRDASDYGDRRTLLPLELGNTVFSTLNDEVMNLFYHFGQGNRNEVQFLTNLSGQTFFFNYLAPPQFAPYASNNGNVWAASDPFGLQSFPTYQSSYITLFPAQVAYAENTNTPDTQTYNSVIDKLNFKRQLSPSSFADLRVFKTYENLIFWYPYDVGSFSDFYEDLNTTNLGEAFDYTNQLNSKHELSLGGDGSYFHNRYFAAFPSFEPTYEPLEDLGCPQVAPLLVGVTSMPGYGGCYIAPFNNALNAALGSSLNGPLPTNPALAPLRTYVSDFSYTNGPLHRWDAWIKDRYQPSDRITITLGLRWDKESIPLPPDAAAQNTTYYIDDTRPAGCTTSYAPPAPLCDVVTLPGSPISATVTQPQQLSPRLAASFEVSPTDTLRFSFGKNIEFIPLSAIEDTYQVPGWLQGCTVANGCFLPLPGYGSTNFVSNLYQQVLLDLTTNDFAQYTPVLPQTAVNYDFSFEHDFGHGIQLRITPYYRRGFNYVVGSQPLLFTLPSGTPVFGPSKEENAGINENTGIEFALQRSAEFGLSGLFDMTYDNTLANYDGDFFPSVNAAALEANHFFHVTYVSPLIGTLNLNYNTRGGLHASTTVSYEYGYRYGVGTKRFIFENGVPVQVLNTDLAAPTPSEAYYFTDPTNPGTVDHPNIVGSRGTPEGPDPGSLFTPATAIVNLTLSHDMGIGPKDMILGLRVENLFGNYTPTRIPANLYYVPQGLGSYGPGSGYNPNQCAPGQTYACEPFMYNQSVYPYENEPSGPPRLYTLFLSAKY
jgi:hypothetical protein